MAPSLTDLYPLARLPRVPDLDLCEKIAVPSISSTNISYIDIGISKSIISSYILKPTPKLVWSFPLSPSTIVECMDVRTEIDDGNSLVKNYIVSVTERKKHKLLLIRRENDEAMNFESKSNTRIQGVKFSSCGKFVYAVSDNGSLNMFKIKEDGLEDMSINLPSTSKSKLLYHAFITNHEFKYKNDLLLTIEAREKSHIYKLTSLNYEKSFEINQVSHVCDSPVIYAYQSALLYKFDINKLEISSLSITDFQATKTVNVGSIIESPSKSIGDYSMISPSVDRLLLSWESNLFLINFKFESLLDTYEKQNKTFLKQVVEVRGNSVNSSSTFAIYLSDNTQKKITDLNLINVNVGLNNLSECLGKSIHKTKQDGFKGLGNVIDDSFDKDSKKLSKELNEVYQELVKLKEKGDTKKWEMIVVPYLKNTSWSSIKKSLGKASSAQEYSVFEVDHDRIVDPNFIHKILSLVFDDQSNFIPECTLIYLLTHPLFPYEYTKGLLTLLDGLDKPRLLRQAIITCPNLSIDEILLQLANENLEIFQDVITRLINEFSINQITHQLNLTLQSKQSNMNLEGILNNLIRLDTKQSWYLVQSIIDVGGLFNWSMDTVNSLSETIENKLATIIANNYNLTLTNQALLINEPIKKLNKNKKPEKKSKDRKSNIIELNNEIQQQQLDSILSIQNNTGKKLKDEGIEISKRIPNYSIEKLVL